MKNFFKNMAIFFMIAGAVLGVTGLIVLSSNNSIKKIRENTQAIAYNQGYEKGYLDASEYTHTQVRDSITAYLHGTGYYIIRADDYLIIPKKDVPVPGVLVIGPDGRVPGTLGREAGAPPRKP